MSDLMLMYDEVQRELNELAKFVARSIESGRRDIDAGAARATFATLLTYHLNKIRDNELTDEQDAIDSEAFQAIAEANEMYENNVN